MIVGVDPGRKTGVAVYDEHAGKLKECITLDWWDAIWYLEDRYAKFIVEDPNLNPPVFARGLTGGRLLRLAQNVGANKEMARLMIEFLLTLGADVTAVRPTKAKWDAETFSRHFSYPKRTSQHARDAARLIHEHYITANGK